MRDGSIRLLALAASVGLHAVWFVQSGGAPDSMQTDLPKRTAVTRLTFAAPEPVLPKPATLPEPVMSPLPEPEQVAHNPKPVPVRKPKPVKKPESFIKKQPVFKAKRESKPTTDEIRKEHVQVASAPAAAPPPAMAPAAPAIDEGFIERERQRYLAGLMAHIEQYKWYPKSARRRRIEGMVHVDFMLFADGSTSNVTVRNASPILLAAARDAVAKAIPLPPPPAIIDCPMKCEFRMSFNLK